VAIRAQRAEARRDPVWGHCLDAHGRLHIESKKEEAQPGARRNRRERKADSHDLGEEDNKHTKVCACNRAWKGKEVRK